MLKIIKQGKKMKHNDLFIHKCTECKTKFIYDLKEDTSINGIFDRRAIIQCPNCDNYDFVEDYFWGITDKKYKKQDLVERVDINEC